MLKTANLRYDQKINILIGILFAVLIGVMFSVYLYVSASPNIQFSQLINAGVFYADVLDTNRDPVTNPSVSFGASSFSFDCETTTGTLGTNSERLYVVNPSSATNGWTLAIAATSGQTAVWSNGSSLTYDYNDPSGSGCTDGADGDTVGGQFTVNPATGTVTADCSSCSNSNISLGTSNAFSEGSLSSVTLINAAPASDDSGRWYLTGATVSQKIPAEQQAATYTISLTITATAS